MALISYPPPFPCILRRAPSGRPLRVAVIAGSGFTTDLLKDSKEVQGMTSKYGDPSNKILRGQRNGVDVFIMSRHGKQRVAPHSLPHHAHMDLLRQLEVDYIIAMCSVGSFQRENSPGAIMIPDDYYCPNSVATFYDGPGVIHTCPGLSDELRKVIIDASDECKPPLKAKVMSSGTYVQTHGPRYETAAESRFYNAMGFDIVGMTMANEADLASEAGMKYAAICSIDNYTNGIHVNTAGSMTEETVGEGARTNLEQAKQLLFASIDRLAAKHRGTA